MSKKPFLLSVVIPCFNESGCIAETHSRLSAVLGALPDCDYEIMFVNDGSRDNTLELLRGIAARDSRARVISFSRNFGHQLAVSAGVEFAAGDAVILIDADLQDPPELIPEMVRLWREGSQVVYGTRAERPGESAMKLLTAKLFYRILNRLSDISIPLDTGDFRLMDRKVVNVLKMMPESDRFVRGMVSWIGFKQTAMTYRRDRRFAGQSNYPLRKMIAFALDGLLSFSSKPLRLATGMGVLCSLLSLIGIIYAVIMRLFTNNWEPGWTLLFIAVTFIGGAQLICFGVLGEYVGRIYSEVKRRPLYIVDEQINITGKTDR